jgi:uncharacterized protein YqgC (DUF456 family)
MWQIVALTLLGLGCGLGVVLTALRLPGTWLMVAGALAYGWWASWQGVDAVIVGVITGLAVIGEAVEFFTSAVTTRRAGGTRQAAWGGLLGGILGMVFLSFLIPIPIVGTVIGALLGCFAGAAVAEWSVHKQIAQGTRVGFFSALGFVLGTAAKLAIAVAMAGILLVAAIWGGPVEPPLPPSGG